MTQPPVLREPAGGVPDVVDTDEGLAAVVRALASGTGPVAVDTERASGYRYGQRAYLVQLHRQGTGTVLVDPIAFGDLRPLGAAIADAEWVLHAASQDLPCLAEVGMRPPRLFDTELAGRLAGFPRVGLASMVEELLGVRLEKAHSAADWSRRPLPADWLRYAALDVELLVDLRDALDAELTRQGKRDWAAEEFAALAAADPFPQRSPDAWRRTSGIHNVRGRRNLAAVRALWHARDALARELDLAPGRVLPDSGVVAAAVKQPRDAATFTQLQGCGGRVARRHVDRWLGALREAQALTDQELPLTRADADGPPPPNRWSDRDPAAAGRLERARAVVLDTAERLAVPAENLVSPDVVRRIAWQPPAVVDPDAVATAMRALGARDWQVQLLATALSQAWTAADDPAPDDA